jgi:uncharacterized protein with NRDE domain
MCLILFALDAHPDYPLVLAANREERHARATAPMAPWTDDPLVLAGRDLEAGGTWLGLHRAGRFAAITNMREGIPTTAGLRSRGDLTRQFLQGGMSAADYAVAVHAEREHYAGFNLLTGDASGLWYCASAAAPRRLEPGVYGLSNGLLDTPWPKVVKGKAALAALIHNGALDSGAAPAALLAILRDGSTPPDHELPDTGIGIDMERALGSCFITGDEYGTRASTALLIDRAGTAIAHEQNFGPGGSVGLLSAWRWPLAALPCG